MKLYDQILGGLRSFFGLEADATEAEIHNALADQKPLSEIENGKALADLNTQFSELSAKVDGMETKISEYQATITQLTDENKTLGETVEAHVATITGHEATIAAKETEITNLTTAHNAKIADLAGQIAKLKAGKDYEKYIETANHAAGAFGGNQQPQITKLTDPILRKALGMDKLN
jgi:predicted  nucleic acid-binding Zn-ribbon protein